MTIADIRNHRRAKHRGRYVTLADGSRVRAGRVYWSVLWYFNVARPWTTSRHIRRRPRAGGKVTP